MRERLSPGRNSMKSSTALGLASCLLILAPSCSEETEADPGPADPAGTPELSVQLPGVILAPAGDTLALQPGRSAIIYYWLPLALYGEMGEDLLFLASLDSTVLPIPIQPDAESRNHAQRIVNDLGISLPVYLADSSVMRTVETDILPFAMLLSPGGESRSESGFGSPSRLLESFRPGK
ncbi:MAG: hypothetical protein AVO35_08145 [Candidatus Aegiribacteria sp. MLS_C]|nr:MAG: hypothetical protein AVO35_08145 [Candidatus Aegiribacteria sp. MLS_C]